MGDNRSENFINALYLLINYPLSIFYGLKSIFLLKVITTYRFLKYGRDRQNPLNLLLTSGIFIWSIYAILVLTLMSSFHLKSKFWAAFAFALLLLQRDYIFVIGYSLLTSLIFIKVLNSFKLILKMQIKVLIVQRVVAHYRKPFFNKLSEVSNLTVVSGKSMGTEDVIEEENQIIQI